MIAYRPVKPGKAGGANIPHEVIDTAIGRHADGFGVAWREVGADGQPTLRVEKYGPDGAKAFRKMLKRVDRSGSEYVAHFRFATQGPKVQRLAHPYEYDDPIEGRVLVFHNGIINIKAESHESDTQVFVERVLAELPSGWWRTPALKYLVTAAIDWSKLVIMTATETVNLHESRGDWDGGIWYSSDHKPAAWKQWRNDGKGSQWGGRAVGTPMATPTSIVPYSASSCDLLPDDTAKSARESADVFEASGESDIELEGGFDGDGNFIVSPTTRTWLPTGKNNRYGLKHAGHNVTEVVVIDRGRDDEWLQSVVCDVCKTMGDAYVIDGTVWIDMSHFDRDGTLVSDADEAEVNEDDLAAAALIDEAEALEAALEDEVERALAMTPGVH